MANIIFKRLTQSQYDGLSNIDKDTLYFTTDTHNLYGNTGQYSSGIYKSVTLSSESSTVNFIDLITQNVDRVGNYLFKQPADSQLSIVFTHVLVSFNYINISSDAQLENFLITALSEFKIQILQYIPGSDNDLNLYIGNSEVLGRFIIGNVTGSSTEYEIYLANPGSLSYQPEHGNTEYIGSVYSAPYDMLSSSQKNSSINVPLMYDDNVATIYNAGDIDYNNINEYIHLTVDPTKSKSKNTTLQFDDDARSVISTLATLDDIPITSNELNTDSDSPVSTKAIMPMITPVKGDATGETYLNTNALPAETYRCYMPIDDEVRILLGNAKYRLRQGNILIVATSSTQHQLIIASKAGFSLYLHTLSNDIVSVYRAPYVKPDEYDRYKSRYCYSDKKVDELIGCSNTEVQIGTWIDKNPLYKKAIQFVSDDGYTANSNTTLSYSDIKLENLVSANISIHRTDGTERWEVANSDDCKVIDFTAASCVLHLGEGVTADAVNLVLEYTKTTDTAVTTLELTDDEDTVLPQLELEM